MKCWMKCMFKRYSAANILLIVLLCTTGCALSTTGRFVPNSQIAYPNSNVRVLGPAQAKQGKFSILMEPKFNIKDLKKAYNKALASYPEANILVNYKEDTTTFMIACFIYMEYKINGEAAKMTIGEQELR